MYVYGLFLYQSSHVNGSLYKKLNQIFVHLPYCYFIFYKKHYCNKSYRLSQDLLVFEDTKVVTPTSDVCMSTVLLLLIV